MPKGETRRRKKSRLYDIVFVPIGENAPTRSFRASRLKLIVLGVTGFMFCVCLTLGVLMYTPVAMYVPIPNPALEERYGRQIVNLQERLNSLAEDVLLLRDYNIQLRKALGENVPKDSSTRRLPSLIADNVEPMPQKESGVAERLLPGGSAPEDLEAGSDAATSTYNAVVTATEGVHAAFPLLTPTDGIVTQEFDPVHGHFGLDIAARKGTPVYAATDGYVVFAGWTYDDGNMLMLAHGGGYVTVYKHTQSTLKTAHTVVRRGEPIALVGTTGRTSFGPHLHFEVWKDGTPQDPNDFLLTPSRIQ
jgi:murein DD-endopeptidase MepM/ murein hydrolase activator NlpD